MPSSTSGTATTSPEMMVMASGRCISEPAPRPSASGINARIAIDEVIRIGRKRIFCGMHQLVHTDLAAGVEFGEIEHRYLGHDADHHRQAHHRRQVQFGTGDAIKGGTPTIISWIAQTFLQLVLLSIIIVGQKVAAEASDKRALNTYNDAKAVLHEAIQIQAHLAAQD